MTVITEEDRIKIIIEALYKNGLINVPTYRNIQKAYTNTPSDGIIETEKLNSSRSDAI